MRQESHEMEIEIVPLALLPLRTSPRGLGCGVPWTSSVLGDGGPRAAVQESHGHKAPLPQQLGRCCSALSAKTHDASIAPERSDRQANATCEPLEYRHNPIGWQVLRV